MRPIAQLLLTLMFVAAASAQNLPDNPAQASAPDPAWGRLQNLAYGTPIVVTSTMGPPVHCFFTNATAEYLDCHPPAQPGGVGYRFHRDDVLSVDPEQWVPKNGQERSAGRSPHPAWISSMIAGGFIVGFIATSTTDAGHAAAAGAIGALVTGAIGAPLAFMPHSNYPASPPPPYGVGVFLPLGARSRGLFHRHALR